jgi:dethiobiotin synthetase
VSEPSAHAHAVFVAGTDTGVGKTRVTVALLMALRAQGLCVAGMKPVAAGTEADGRNEDAALIRAASTPLGGEQPAPEDINPYCLQWAVSPHLAARRERVTIELARIRAAYRRLAQRYTLVLVEGTGGWLAPISEQATMADVAAALDLPVVVVVGLRLGCLNHSLLTAQALAAAGRTLIGWIGSVIEPQMEALADNIATLQQRLRAPLLGVLPFETERGRDSKHLGAAAKLLADTLLGGAREEKAFPGTS